MQRRSATDNSGLPTPLMKSPPRDVRVSALGGAMLVVAAALVAGGMWQCVEVARRAETSERHVGLFASERLVTGGEVIRLRNRGGDDDRRVSAHYIYSAGGREFAGETALRRSERDSYAVGSPVAVWYLPSEPEASWLDGYAPRPFPAWPATVVPLGAGAAALALILLVRRQWNLLAYGRAAMATITRVEKKKTDKGTVWRVHFQWTTLSGATRTGRYNHGKKDVPAIGSMIPILYDRDNTFRHSKYPMPFVHIAATSR